MATNNIFLIDIIRFIHICNFPIFHTFAKVKYFFRKNGVKINFSAEAEDRGFESSQGIMC
jgi:hypothetical protein